MSIGFDLTTRRGILYIPVSKLVSLHSDLSANRRLLIFQIPGGFSFSTYFLQSRVIVTDPPRYIWLACVHPHSEEDDIHSQVSNPGSLVRLIFLELSNDSLESEYLRATSFVPEFEIPDRSSLQPRTALPCTPYCSGTKWEVSLSETVPVPYGHFLELGPLGHPHLRLRARVLCPASSSASLGRWLAQLWVFRSSQFKLHKLLAAEEELFNRAEAEAQVSVREAFSGRPDERFFEGLADYTENIMNLGAELLLRQNLGPEEYPRVLRVLGDFALECSRRLCKDISQKTLPNRALFSIGQRIRKNRKNWITQRWLIEKQTAFRTTHGRSRGTLRRVESSTETIKLLAEPSIGRTSQDSRFLHSNIDAAAIPTGKNSGDPVKRRELVIEYQNCHSNAPVSEIWQMAQVDESQFHRWQRGEHVSDNVIRRLARVLGKTPEEVNAR
jgi:hypothetical protein